jgi:hypothetical protein
LQSSGAEGGQWHHKFWNGMLPKVRKRNSAQTEKEELKSIIAVVMFFGNLIA